MRIFGTSLQTLLEASDPTKNPDSQKIARATQEFLNSKEKLSVEDAKTLGSRVFRLQNPPSTESPPSAKIQTGIVALLFAKVLKTQNLTTKTILELQTETLKKCADVIGKNIADDFSKFQLRDILQQGTPNDVIEALKTKLTSTPIYAKTTVIKLVTENIIKSVSTEKSDALVKELLSGLKDIMSNTPKDENVLDLEDFLEKINTKEPSSRNSSLVALRNFKELIYSNSKKNYNLIIDILTKVKRPTLLLKSFLGSSDEECKSQCKDTLEIKDLCFKEASLDIKDSKKLFSKATALFLKHQSRPDQIILEEGVRILRNSPKFSNCLISHIEESVAKAKRSPRPQYFYRQAMEDMKILLEQSPEALKCIDESKWIELEKVCIATSWGKTPLAIENLVKIKLTREKNNSFNIRNVSQITQLVSAQFKEQNSYFHRFFVKKPSSSESAYIRDKHLTIITIDKARKEIKVSTGKSVGEGVATQVFSFDDNTVIKVTKISLGLVGHLAEAENEQSLMTELHGTGICVGLESKCSIKKMYDIVHICAEDQIASYQELLTSILNPPAITLIKGTKCDGDLRDLLKIETVQEQSKQNANTVLSRISSVITSMHERCIVHGDIKIDNVLYKTQDTRTSITEKNDSNLVEEAVLTDFKGAQKVSLDKDSKPLSQIKYSSEYIRETEKNQCTQIERLVDIIIKKDVSEFYKDSFIKELKLSENNESMLEWLLLPSPKSDPEVKEYVIKKLKTEYLNLRKGIDIFQFGVIAYQLALGTAPSTTEEGLPYTLDKSRFADKLEPDKITLTLNDFYGKKKADLILRMLSDNPKERPTAEAVKATFASTS